MPLACVQNALAAVGARRKLARTLKELRQSMSVEAAALLLTSMAILCCCVLVATVVALEWTLPGLLRGSYDVYDDSTAAPARPWLLTRVNSTLGSIMVRVLKGSRVGGQGLGVRNWRL